MTPWWRLRNERSGSLLLAGHDHRDSPEHRQREGATPFANLQLLRSCCRTACSAPMESWLQMVDGAYYWAPG